MMLGFWKIKHKDTLPPRNKTTGNTGKHWKLGDTNRTRKLLDTGKTLDN